MKILSDWRSVRLWETQIERDLHRSYSLRTHGILIGTFTMLLMWGVSALQMHLLHVHSLAVRYLLTLGVGYLGYLLVLRWWARRLVEGREVDANVDAPDLDFGGGSQSRASAGDGSGLSDVASGALDIAGGADEAAARTATRASARPQATVVAAAAAYPTSPAARSTWPAAPTRVRSSSFR